MRTTLRTDDDIVEKVKDLARDEDISFGRMLNRVIRAGLAARKAGGRTRARFRQETFDLGDPGIDLNKALALASALEDDETARKFALRK